MRFTLASITILAALSAATAFQPSALRLPITTTATSNNNVRYPTTPAAASLIASQTKKSSTSLYMTTSDDTDDSKSPTSSSGVGGGGTATIPNEIFNLVKSIVGAGVLSLPAGIAAFGNAPSAVLPAVLLICIIGGFSAYGFSLIGRVCSYTGGVSYRGAWSGSVGDETSWIPGEYDLYDVMIVCCIYIYCCLFV